MADFKVGDRACNLADYGTAIDPGDIVMVTGVDGEYIVFSDKKGRLRYRPANRYAFAVGQPAPDAALEWLKRAALEAMEGTGVAGAYRQAIHNMLRDVYSISVENVPASVRFVSIKGTP